MKKTSLPTIRSTDCATYALPTRAAAWSFMRECEHAGLSAGYPSLRSPDIRTPDARTVEVGIRTDADRIVADRLARGASVIVYAFAGSPMVYA